MSNTSPKLRFSVFRNEWVGRSLLSLSERIGDGIHSTPKYDSEGEYYFINGNNLVEGTIALDENTKRLNAQEYEKHARKLGQGTILISINGTIGNIALYNNERIILGKSVCYINTNSEIDKFFLYYLLNSSRIQKYFINELTGSTIKNLSLKSISKTLVYLPTIQEQQKIASFLSSVDEWINNLKEQKELLQQYKKGIMQKIFSQEIRFKDETGNEFPEWEEKKLEDIAIRIWIGLVTTMTSNYSIEGNRLIRNSNIRDNRIEDDKPIYLDNVFAEKYRDRCLRLNDLVTVHTGDVGTTAIIDQEFDGAHGFATLNTRLDNRIAENSYVAYFLNSYKYKNWALRFSTGDGRNNLNLNDFIKSVIPLPVFSEQQKISSFLSLIGAMIGEKEEQINQAEDWKKGLLQELFI